MKQKVRLLLVGAGHSHLEVLRRQILERRQDISVTLISLSPRQHYSGMVPGYLAGIYSEEQIAFDLPDLLRRAGGDFLLGKVARVDPAARRVQLESGEEIPYDLISFGVGSTTRGSDRPDVRAVALTVKPIPRAAALRQRLLQLVGEKGGRAARVVIVGAGAAGVEVACAAVALLDGARRPREITVVDGADEILSDYSAKTRQRAETVLASKKISLKLGAFVESVRADAVELSNRAEIPSDLTVWLTGPQAYGLFRESGLTVDRSGFLLVDDSLRSVSDPRIFGVGDCVTLRNFPLTPKAGVYAVREGPILWRSLLAAIEGGSPPRYRPQKGFLSILNTADGKALLRYGALVSWSRWAWKLKDRIDRRFVEKYQRLL